MSRLVKLKDVEGTEMYINLDDITGIRIPSVFSVKQGELHIALVMMRGVNLNMTVDLLNKLLPFLQDDVLNKDDDKKTLLDLAGRN